MIGIGVAITQNGQTEVQRFTTIVVGQTTAAGGTIVSMTCLVNLLTEFI